MREDNLVCMGVGDHNILWKWINSQNPFPQHYTYPLHIARRPICTFLVKGQRFQPCFTLVLMDIVSLFWANFFIILIHVDLLTFHILCFITSSVRVWHPNKLLHRLLKHGNHGNLHSNHKTKRQRNSRN